MQQKQTDMTKAITTYTPTEDIFVKYSGQI